MTTTHEQLSQRRAELLHTIEETLRPIPSYVEVRDHNWEVWTEHGKLASQAWQAGDRDGWRYYAGLRDQANPDRKEATAKINSIKNSNLKHLRALNAVEREMEEMEGLRIEWPHRTLGNSFQTVSYPSGSPQWHAQRANGIGGSDVGAIFGLSPWNTREDIFRLKTKQDKAEVKPAHDALIRGHEWEERIVRMFQERNPERQIIHSKASWCNTERGYHLANVDGLLADGRGAPAGILEIKTSSTPYTWAKGVPAYYRLQVLWYLAAFGWGSAILVVLIDDYDYREYEIVPEEGEIERMLAGVDEFADEIKAWYERH